MSSEPPASITEALVVTGEDNQIVAIPLAGLPAGSLITITIRVGPEPAPAPGEAPLPLPPSRHMGQSRINRT